MREGRGRVSQSLSNKNIFYGKTEDGVVIVHFSTARTMSSTENKDNDLHFKTTCERKSQGFEPPIIPSEEDTVGQSPLQLSPMLIIPWEDHEDGTNPQAIHDTDFPQIRCTFT